MNVRLPGELLNVALREVGLRFRTPRIFHRLVFTEIHRLELLRGGQTVSGPGSTRERVASFRDDLIRLLQSLGTKVLLDAPCGDFNWMADVADVVSTYIGIDIVPELIRRNTERYAESGREFICGDLTRDPLPHADVILCRDCLVHFSFVDIRAALKNFKRSGSAYLLTTTFIDKPWNRDVRTGGWRTLNLQKPPFSFPQPLALVDEHCDHTAGVYRDKRIGLWSLDELVV